MTRTLSIVCASGAGGEFLFKTLAALRPQVEEHGAELIVVDRVGGEQLERVRREHPEARVIAPELDHRPGVPELRAIGLEAATGEIVAVIEEHTRPNPGWVRAVLDNFTDADAAIGGPILDDAYPRRRDWVVYFSEYHNYMPPWTEAEYFHLNGANIAYSREKVLRHRDVLGSGWWEAGLHPLLAGEGRFRSIPAMGAHHMGPFDYGYYLRQRYLLSRVWGATQRARVGIGSRLAHILAAPIFPLFLLARMTRSVLDKGRLAGQFVRTLPLLVPAVFAYTWGEFLGYLVGPGTALEHVE
jgi:glycosyltransferase involved in cell wall biosynthesis